MSTRERAKMLFDVLTDSEIDMFVYLFEDKHKNVSAKEKECSRLSEAFSGSEKNMFPEGRRQQSQPENSDISMLNSEERAVYNKLSKALSGFGEDFLSEGRPEFVPSKREEL